MKKTLHIRGKSEGSIIGEKVRRMGNTSYITQEEQTENSQVNNECNYTPQALSEKLGQVSFEPSKRTIYRVHSHLRKTNPEAYEPEVIAIGPYHRSKDHLKKMEDHKLRYLHILLRRNNQAVESYISAVKDLESEARACYGDPISLGSTEFLAMLVLDGCFVLELVRKYNTREAWQTGYYKSHEDDPIFSMKWIIDSLQRDLMLFENQLPFFVLRRLFTLIQKYHDQYHDTVLKLHFWGFFTNHPAGKEDVGLNLDENEAGIMHLLDLMHRLWFPRTNNHPQKEQINMGKCRFIVRATALREANVKFKKKACEVSDTFNIEFKNGTILMPPLVIEHRTESMFRNLIVYEQYFGNPEVNYVTDYVKFLDCLIDSQKDAEILIRKGIVDNWLGDDEVVAKIVNRLVDLAAGPSSHTLYADTYKNVNEYCDKRRNRWTAMLRRNYLNSPCAVISIIGAIALLLLTVTQTVFAILK